MMPKELMNPDLSDALDDLRSREEPFAIATIVRTAGTTSAKPGAKALLRADGTILQGWLGGGCTRGAVRKATLKAFEDAAPQLISVTPEDSLSNMGVAAGDEVAGMRFMRNGCPSEGTIDVFIEPCLPRPELVVFGSSPVAQALAAQAPAFDWDVAQPVPETALDPASQLRTRMIVIATQGQGDLAALKQALADPATHVAFVGSRRKYRALSEKLQADGISEMRIASVEAPAGLDIGAVTPEEIALSILSRLTQVRRQGLKEGSPDA